jgi:hypothetical protein
MHLPLTITAAPKLVTLNHSQVTAMDVEFVSSNGFEGRIRYQEMPEPDDTLG